MHDALKIINSLIFKKNDFSSMIIHTINRCRGFWYVHSRMFDMYTLIAHEFLQWKLLLLRKILYKDKHPLIKEPLHIISTFSNRRPYLISSHVISPRSHTCPSTLHRPRIKKFRSACGSTQRALLSIYIKARTRVWAGKIHRAKQCGKGRAAVKNAPGALMKEQVRASRRRLYMCI